MEWCGLATLLHPSQAQGLGQSENISLQVLLTVAGSCQWLTRETGVPSMLGRVTDRERERCPSHSPPLSAAKPGPRKLRSLQSGHRAPGKVGAGNGEKRRWGAGAGCWVP